MNRSLKYAEFIQKRGFIMKNISEDNLIIRKNRLKILKIVKSDWASVENLTFSTNTII